MKENYLNFIQSNIRRYALQSFVTKMVSLVMAIYVIINVFMLKSSSNPNVSILVLGIMAFFAILFWLVDGHSVSMQSEYIKLYNKAINAADDAVAMTMEVPVLQSLNPAELWRKQVMFYHIGIIFCLGCLSLLAS